MKRWTRWFGKMKNDTFITICVFFILAGILYGDMYTNIRPEKLDVELFSIAKKDIISPISVEDEEATEKKKQEAALEVEDQYVLRTDFAEDRVEIISAIFDAVTQVKTEDTVTQETETDETTPPPPEDILLEKRIEMLSERIPSELQDDLTVSNLKTLLTVSSGQLDSAKTTTVTLIQEIMKQPIKVGEEDTAVQVVLDEIQKVNLPDNLKDVMGKIATYAIIPNYVYDLSKTEELRQQAMDEVNAVRIVEGQVLVKEGQVIDRDMYKQLELVGLLDEENSPNIFIGLALFVVSLTSVIVYYFQFIPLKKRIIYVLLFAITILLMKGISLFQFDIEIGYIFPAAMATMLIKVLLTERMAIISSVLLAICGSVIYNDDMLGIFNYSIGIYFFLSGLAGVIFISDKHYRSKIIRAGLYVSVVNMIVITSLFLIKNGLITGVEIGAYLSLAFLSGFISAVLTLGLMPVFEAWFGILSTMKLIELSSPNYPLLRKILLEAPGTYHHSVMVANLSEAACDAIGANGFLARVGAYYHDIGKTKRPHFYIENQMNTENPHDKISPQLSKTIITAHPYDGADILREHKIPKEIIDIAEQHHGTTLLKYFYYKAKEKEDADVVEADFRYPGPKPQTKEAAIVGIADSVEAAVRSMSNPTPQKIEALVQNIVQDRMQDGQFDECDITFKELNIAIQSMYETLKGVFHQRIEYPDVKNSQESIAKVKATS